MALNDDDDGDFIVELTRQIEDYMLHEDDDDNNHKNTHVTCFVNQNQNQDRVNSKQGRWKKTESTQQMSYARGRRVMSYGSGMRAVFLNRPGSQNGYNGTGVFLPPSATFQQLIAAKKTGTYLRQDIHLNTRIHMFWVVMSNMCIEYGARLRVDL